MWTSVHGFVIEHPAYKPPSSPSSLVPQYYTLPRETWKTRQWPSLSKDRDGRITWAKSSWDTPPSQPMAGLGGTCLSRELDREVQIEGSQWPWVQSPILPKTPGHSCKFPESYPSVWHKANTCPVNSQLDRSCWLTDNTGRTVVPLVTSFQSGWHCVEASWHMKPPGSFQSAKEILLG
jgi:hypothetical protein